MGQLNLPSTMPVHASQMYAKNIQNLLDLLIKNGKLDPDFEDEIVKGTVITRGGDVVHEMTKQRLAEQVAPAPEPAANQDLVSAPDQERSTGTSDADGAQADVTQDTAAAGVQDSTA
jgi:NAD(P) transhydrogenase subunit alpha